MLCRILPWVLIFILGIEVYFHQVLPPIDAFGQIFKDNEDPEILYELRPDSRIIFSGTYVKIPSTTIKISKDGIRDYEYSLTKDKNIFRIVVLGDSIAFGWGVELEDTFAKKLESMLNQNLATRCEVINFGVPGYNASQKFALLKGKAIRYNPDSVIVHLVHNDFFETYNYYRPKFINQTLLKKSYIYRWIIQRLRSYKQKRFLKELAYRKKLATADMARFSSIIEQLKRISLDRGCKIMFLFNKIEPWMEEIVEEIKENGFIVTNCDKALKGSSKEAFLKKDNHPNAIGHEIIAGKIYNSMAENGMLPKQ